MEFISKYKLFFTSVYIAFWGSCVIFCFGYFIGSKKPKRKLVLGPWNQSWKEWAGYLFGIFATEILFILCTKLILDRLNVPLNQSQKAIFIGMSGQLGLLFSLVGLRIFDRNFSEAQINTKKLSLAKSIPIGLYQYILSVPFIILTNLYWVTICKYSYKFFEMPFNWNSQELVSFLLKNNPSWIIFVISIFACLIAPFTEELFFRVLIYRFLKQKTNSTIALVVSSFVFACLHDDWSSFLPLFLLGMLLGRIYEVNGNIKPAIAFHAIFNINTIFILIIEKNLVI